MFWNKEKKLRKQIAKKQEKIQKLKEEILKMGKLTIRDGKLVPMEDVKRQEGQVIAPQNTEVMQELDENVYANEPLQQEEEIYVPPTPAPMPPPQYRQPQPSRQMYQQPEVPQPRYVQKPVEPDFNAFKISIELVSGTIIETNIPPEKEALDRILTALVEAVDKQSTVAIGSHFINGRNIIGFTYIKV